MLQRYDIGFFRMCRNITELRGLEPPATREEVEAAARQYVRKVTGVAKPNIKIAAALDAFALEVADVTERALNSFPTGRQPPPTPAAAAPTRVRKRMGLAPFSA